MSIEIIKPGILTTLVDAGRSGYRSQGICPGGPMDEFAMRVGNYLVGNVTVKASLEVHFPAPEILFHRSLVISAAGIGFEVQVDDEIFPLWKPLVVRKGAMVKFIKAMGGSRCYLATPGGWKGDAWLGSISTPLGEMQKQGIVETEESGVIDQETKALSWGISKKEWERIYSPAHEIRCLEGPEADWLSPESNENLSATSFRITPKSNRMGYRLEGKPMALKDRISLVSCPVDFGTIQLLPDGNLTILMADHQTTGGYPRIASVIKADLPKLAQLNPGDKIDFRMISLEQAEQELVARERVLRELKNACVAHYKNYFR